MAVAVIHTPKRHKVRHTPVPVLQEAMQKVLQFPQDIHLVARTVGTKNMANAFGVTREAVWLWRKRLRTPGDPVIILAIMGWAELIRQQRGLK